MKPAPQPDLDVPEPDYGGDIEQARRGRLRDRGAALMDVLNSFGTSRELSIARTKLEEAIMWTQKHLSK